MVWAISTRDGSTCSWLMSAVVSRNNSPMAIGTIKIRHGRLTLRISLLHPVGLKIAGGCHVLMFIPCRLRMNRWARNGGRPYTTTMTPQGHPPIIATAPVPTEERERENYGV